MRQPPISTTATDRIVCPHCGGTFEHDNIQYVDLNGKPMEYDCEHCEKPFEVTADITVYYTTRKLKE
jgi:DNA-directed RNA polymerase subunit RPC12/RpoP